MKTKLIFAFLVLGIAVLLSSCFSAPKTYSKNFAEDMPEDQGAEITFGSGIHLREWNDIDMKENLYGKKKTRYHDTINLTVPAGSSNFLISVVFTFTNNSSHTVENVELDYYLDEGRKYEIKRRFNSLGLKRGSWSTYMYYELFVEIFDITEDPVLLKEWRLGET